MAARRSRFFGGTHEARVDHPERLEQTLLEEGAEGSAGDHFDQSGRDVDAHAVLKARARLEGERKLRKVGDRDAERDLRVEQLAPRVHPADGESSRK